MTAPMCFFVNGGRLYLHNGYRLKIVFMLIVFSFVVTLVFSIYNTGILDNSIFPEPVLFYVCNNSLMLFDAYRIYIK